MSEGVLHVTDSRTFLHYDLPISRNSIKATDLQAIKGPTANANPAHQVENGLRVFDAGFKNTAVLESKITFIDGSRGLVQYRGKNVADFWDSAQFEDLAYLLIWGAWPSAVEKESFRSNLAKAAEHVPESVANVVRSFPRKAAPMQMIIAGLATYLGEKPESIPAVAGANLYQRKPELDDKAIIQTLAAFQVCAGLAARHRAGKPFVGADPAGTFLSNLLKMMGKVNEETGQPEARTLSALQRVWALGADLGHTNSTAALLHGASTLGDPISCLISALSSGYGILHFGAAEVSLKTLLMLGGKQNVPFLIQKVKAGKAKLFGYGHRMFNTVDPRIEKGAQVLAELESKSKLVETALEIDRIAGSDEWFTSRKLEANADLYIGIIYTALDFDPSFVPVMIALMRSGGMMAHWRESMQQQKTAIWRPQQFYTGEVGEAPAARENGQQPQKAEAVLTSVWDKQAETTVITKTDSTAQSTQVSVVEVKPTTVEPQPISNIIVEPTVAAKTDIEAPSAPKNIIELKLNNTGNDSTQTKTIEPTLVIKTDSAAPALAPAPVPAPAQVEAKLTEPEPPQSPVALVHG